MSEDWKSRYEAEYAIVDRCWKALGITSFEQAGGNALYEIIAGNKDRIAALEAALAEAKADADLQAQFHTLWKGKSQDLEQALAERTRERDDIAYKVEHPELAHLHYDGCPFKPWQGKYDGDIPDPRPECTCGEAAKGAYWKGQWVLERGYHEITKRERTEAQAREQQDRAAIRAYKKDHDEESQYVAAGEICECEICKAHAAAIARAESQRATEGT